MKGLVSSLALGLVLAFTAPAFSWWGRASNDKADCEKAGM
jgi:hypothetical protein